MMASTSDSDVTDRRAEILVFRDYSGDWTISVETSLDQLDNDDAYSVVVTVNDESPSFTVERFGRCSTRQRELCDDIARELGKYFKEFSHALSVFELMIIDVHVKDLCARYQDRLDISATIHAAFDVMP